MKNILSLLQLNKKNPVNIIYSKVQFLSDTQSNTVASNFSSFLQKFFIGRYHQSDNVHSKYSLHFNAGYFPGPEQLTDCSETLVVTGDSRVVVIDVSFDMSLAVVTIKLLLNGCKVVSEKNRTMTF